MGGPSMDLVKNLLAYIGAFYILVTVVSSYVREKLGDEKANEILEDASYWTLILVGAAFLVLAILWLIRELTAWLVP